MITFLLKIDHPWNMIILAKIYYTMRPMYRCSPSGIINKGIIVNEMDELALEIFFRYFVVCFIELLTANICQF